jgi:hypothetical protein
VRQKKTVESVPAFVYPQQRRNVALTQVVVGAGGGGGGAGAPLP